MTVSVKPAPPDVNELGLRLVIVGITGAFMVKVTAADAVLPAAFITVTGSVPALAIMLACTVAVNNDELKTLVESAVPFQ